MSATEPIVYIVDDDHAVCDALQVLLESVGLRSQTYHSPVEFLDTYDPERPGCLLLDLRMPQIGGLQVQQVLNSRRADLPVIIITAHGDMTTAVAAMRAGAIDVFAKPFNNQLLLDRINEAIQRDLERHRLRAERKEIAARVAGLSQREQQVLTGLLKGKSNREIAEALGLTTKTIDSHRARLMAKMNASSLAELVQLALKVSDPSDLPHHAESQLAADDA